MRLGLDPCCFEAFLVAFVSAACPLGRDTCLGAHHAPCVGTDAAEFSTRAASSLTSTQFKLDPRLTAEIVAWDAIGHAHSSLSRWWRAAFDPSTSTSSMSMFAVPSPACADRGAARAHARVDIAKSSLKNEYRDVVFLQGASRIPDAFGPACGSNPLYEHACGLTSCPLLDHRCE